MFKEITIGVSSAVLTTSIVGFLSYLGNIPLSFFIPKNAVVAFHSDNCPENGWSVYTPAYGRFIRGIDRSERVDPEGLRTAGHVQEDQFKTHKHERPKNVYVDGANPRVANGRYYGFGYSNSPDTGSTGGDETRPKNVALLYCRKD